LYDEKNDALTNALITDDLFFGICLTPVLLVMGIVIAIVAYVCYLAFGSFAHCASGNEMVVAERTGTDGNYKLTKEFKKHEKKLMKKNRNKYY